jgi:hypothetical protein
MTQSEAWVYYFYMCLTSPGYSLPLSHFPPPELYSLETRALPEMITKVSFNCNTSRKVLYGPVRLNRGRFHPFATEQGIDQIQCILKQWTSSLDLLYGAPRVVLVSQS